MSVTWTCKSFSSLSLDELYTMLRLRNEVFVVEQNCVYQDIDNKDPQAWHLMGLDDSGNLVAYTRLFPPGINHELACIGRVVTSPQVRQQGLGRELMKQSVKSLYALWGKQPIHIGAQVYLKDFYESLGFVQTSPVYLEDGIEHIEMQLDELPEN